MAEEQAGPENVPAQNTNEPELDPIVTQAHGVQQQVKMEILNMIHSGESPFDIIYHIAKRLEDVSGEPGYAKYVEDQIRAVFAINRHKKNIERLKIMIQKAEADHDDMTIIKN